MVKSRELSQKFREEEETIALHKQKNPRDTVGNIASCHQMSEETSRQNPLSDCEVHAARLGGSKH